MLWAWDKQTDGWTDRSITDKRSISCPSV